MSKYNFKVYCECGYGVRGRNESHAAENLKAHRNSKLHEKLMEIKSLDKTTQSNTDQQGEQPSNVA